MDRFSRTMPRLRASSLSPVLQGQGGHRLIQQPAADEVIVPVDEAAFQHLRIPGGDPAQPDPGQENTLDILLTLMPFSYRSTMEGSSRPPG